MIEFLIENIIINFFIIISLIKILNLEIFKFKLLFYLIIIVILNYILKEYKILYLIFQILTFNIYILKNNINIRQILKINLLYLEINILYLAVIVSSSILFKISLNSIITRLIMYILTFFIIIIFNRFIWKIFKEVVTYNDLIYEFILNDKKYRIFLDTGNNLIDYEEDREIIILDEDKYKKINNNSFISNNKLKKINITVNTINKKSKLKGYEFYNVTIRNKEISINLNKVIVIFSKIKNNRYDGIIGINTYLRKLKRGNYE